MDDRSKATRDRTDCRAAGRGNAKPAIDEKELSALQVDRLKLKKLPKPRIYKMKGALSELE